MSKGRRGEMTKYEMVREIERVINRPTTRLWATDKDSLLRIMLALQELEAIRAACDEA